jgi:hypothetical protein
MIHCIALVHVSCNLHGLFPYVTSACAAQLTSYAATTPCQFCRRLLATYVDKRWEYHICLTLLHHNSDKLLRADVRCTVVAPVFR